MREKDTVHVHVHRYYDTTFRAHLLRQIPLSNICTIIITDTQIIARKLESKKKKKERISTENSCPTFTNVCFYQFPQLDVTGSSIW